MEPIKSVAELRDMDPVDLVIHKNEIYRAANSATTDLEREPYTKQLERINKIQNEAETPDQEKLFLQLKQEAAETMKLAIAVEATI